MATDTHIRRRGTRGIALVLLTASLLAADSGAPRSLPAGSVALAEAEEYEEHEGRAPTSAELVPSVEAAFTRESYRPGTAARLVVFNRARGITLQVFRVGAEDVTTRGNSEMRGVPVTPASLIGTSRGRRVVRVAVGDWPSGLYFARLEAGDGRVGFAPFVVRPVRLGGHRVAVVLPTLTWQAYNLRDDDGDGTGDSWYAEWRKHTARMGRPFLNRGVPYNFRAYDLPFLRWLAETGKDVDVLSDADLGTVPSAGVLARAYDLIIFPGHHEYVTTREYDVTKAYRDLGGNLMFLSANNFFWRVVRHGNVIEKTKQWRDLGRPEAALIGVQYRANDRGTHRGPWIVRRTEDAAWVFAGTGLRAGGAFSSGGIEIDRTTPASPRTVRVLAEIPDLLGPGLTAQMTYYETARGARVFAAGAFTLAGALGRQRAVGAVVENIWARLTSGSEDA